MANARCAPIDLGGGAGDGCVTIGLPRLRVRLRLMVTAHEGRGLAQFFGGGMSKAGEEPRGVVCGEVDVELDRDAKCKAEDDLA